MFSPFAPSNLRVTKHTLTVSRMKACSSSHTWGTRLEGDVRAIATTCGNDAREFVALSQRSIDCEACDTRQSAW